MASSTEPCGSCPWRKDNPAGGERIPRFDLDLMRGLRRTCGKEDGFRTVMACHHSPVGEERACIGYVAVEGWRNINVRILAIQGQLDMPAIEAAAADLDLWESFEDMLAAYEQALAGSDGDE